MASKNQYIQFIDKNIELRLNDLKRQLEEKEKNLTAISFKTVVSPPVEENIGLEQDVATENFTTFTPSDQSPMPIEEEQGFDTFTPSDQSPMPIEEEKQRFDTFAKKDANQILDEISLLEKTFSSNNFYDPQAMAFKLPLEDKTVEKLLNECRAMVLSAKDEEADIVLKNNIFLDAKINDLKSNPHDLNEDDMKKVKACITTLEIVSKIIERQNANS